MKSFLSVLALLMTLSSQPCLARSNDRDRCERHYEHRHDRQLYYVGENDVFYDGVKIDGASASSFSILRDGYAKDAWNVYYLSLIHISEPTRH